MSKHNHQRGSSVSMALAGMTVLVAVAGCDGKRVADTPNAEPRLAASPEIADSSYASIAEARHFDLYSRYQMMFDDAADFVPPHAQDHGGAIRPAVDVVERGRAGAASGGCFLVNGSD